jgi:hypothetical protein
MIHTKRYLLTLSAFILICFNSYSQDCQCTIQEVEENKVKPCNLVAGNVDTVFNASELRSSIIKANQQGGDMTILIANGTYAIASTAWYPYITGNNIVFRSLSGHRDSVILTGQGMKDVAPKVEIGIYAAGNHITIADLTIRAVGNHGIAATGEHLNVYNVRIQNTFEQMIKGTSGSNGADSATVQCSLFEYTAGIGPQYYIGGLDIHDGDDWQVKDNIFRNISSPSQFVAEHAIHFWNSSSNNIVERNRIINCDRGIGFGLGSSASDGGIIRNNMIYNDGSKQFDDVGISLETSPNTKVYNNTIYIEYANAIEYRFAATKNVMITNNLTNKQIKLRNGAQASLAANYTSASPAWFSDLSAGDLRLNSKVIEVVDKGLNIAPDVIQDIDKVRRPQLGSYDIGAHEYKKPLFREKVSQSRNEIIVCPNPNHGHFNIEITGQQLKGEIGVNVFNSKGQVILKKKYKLRRLVPIRFDGKSGLYTIILEDQHGTRMMKRFVYY